MPAELIECKTMFSNGSEYEWFLETQCFKCSRYRQGYCRIYNACEDARFDESRFPYSDLMDFKGYGGKTCKSFTTEKLTRHRTVLKGQMSMEAEDDQRTGD